MSTAAFALLASAAALAATGVVAALVLRARRTAATQLAEGLLGVSARMDALAGEIATTVERVREDALRARVAGSLGRTLDLDEVLARCADAAASFHGVAAAVATIDVDGRQLTAAAGLAVAPARVADDRRPAPSGVVGGPPDGSPVRAVGISYHYLPAHDDAAGMRSAIAVPLACAGEHAGFLTVFGRGEEPPVEGNDFALLEALAREAGQALESARRRGSGPADRERDPLTGLGTRRAFHETLALEVARAQRHGRRLVVCVFDVDDFKRTSVEIGRIESDDVLAAVAGVLRETSGSAGLVYRSGADEFAVILPESSRIDAEALHARAQATLRQRPPSPGLAVTVSAGIAELEPEDDGVSLFERSQLALQRAKHLRKGTAA